MNECLITDKGLLATSTCKWMDKCDEFCDFTTLSFNSTILNPKPVLYR